MTAVYFFLRTVSQSEQYQLVILEKGQRDGGKGDWRCTHTEAQQRSEGQGSGSSLSQQGTRMGAGEMAKWLRALVPLPEELGLALSIHRMTHNQLYL